VAFIQLTLVPKKAVLPLGRPPLNPRASCGAE
jgi:hypothetical protein